MKRYAHPIASAVSRSRSQSRAAVSKASRKNSPCQITPATSVTRAATRSTAQIRSAIRPTLRLPATSCAEPGRTRVISIRATARRNRTRAARSPGVKREACDPGEGAGGIEMPLSRTSYGEGRCPVSITSHRRNIRHDAPGDPGRPGGTGYRRRMNERPRGDGEPAEGTPEYRWLYGGGAEPTGPAPREPRPDETRVMPAMSRPSNQPAGAPPGRATAPPQGRAGSPPTPPPAPTPGGQRAPRRRGPRFYLRIVLVL